MRIASITMVGQFPHGIELHLRNLRWALTPDDHSYIFTLPQHAAAQGLTSDARVTCIAHQPAQTNPRGMVNFWREFPELIDRHRIEPEWFLLMQQDIWFTAPPTVPADPRRIHAFLPASHYHNIMIGERVFHPRVWEGAQLVHCSLIAGARRFGVDFSFVPNTFVDRDRLAIEARMGGPIGISDFGKADTLDEFGLYCALVAGTAMEHQSRAVHLRGPEVLHRRFPDIYRGATRAMLAAVQSQIPYLDVLLAVAMYYVAGLWETIDDLDWAQLCPASAQALQRVLETGDAWLPPPPLARLAHVVSLARVAQLRDHSR